MLTYADLCYVSRCGGLSCLLNLNMSCNQMCVLPDELGYMVNLEKLRLDQNQLRHLPETIGRNRLHATN